MKELIEKIAIPRRSGSEGEKKAREFITAELGKILKDKGRTETEEFSFSSDNHRIQYGSFSVILVILLFINLMLLIYVKTPPLKYAPVITGPLIIIFLLMASRWNSLNEKLSYRKSKSMIDTANIIGKLGNESTGTVIFSAHYDSKSSGITSFTRVALLGLAFCCCLFVAVYSVGVSIYLYYNPIVDITMDIAVTRMNLFLAFLSIVVMLIFMIFFFSKSGNESKGYLDNASGVTVLLELAQYFAENPPENLNVWFLFTAAEEEGLVGMIRFLDMNKDLDKTNTCFINLDCVSAAGRLYVTGKKPPQNNAFNLLDVIKNACRQSEIECHYYSSVPGICYDGTVAAFHKYPAVNFSYCKFFDIMHIHTKKDNETKLDEGSLKNTFKVCKKTVEIMDGVEN